MRGNTRPLDGQTARILEESAAVKTSDALLRLAACLVATASLSGCATHHARPLPAGPDTSIRWKSQLSSLLSGSVATQIQSGGSLADVRVWTPDAVRDRVGQIDQRLLKSPDDGHLFPVSRIAQGRCRPARRRSIGRTCAGGTP